MAPFNFIESHKKDLIKFIQKLVQTPSQNGVDSLRPIVRVVSQELEDFGFKPLLIDDKKYPCHFVFCNKIKKGKNCGWMRL